MIRLGAPSSLSPAEASAIKLPKVDIKVLKERQNRAIAKAKDDAAFIGDGVTAHSQAIFDSLRKTMPCEWKGQDMLVLKEVTISPPYTPQSCQGSGAVLQRVKKVLTGVLDKVEKSNQFKR